MNDSWNPYAQAIAASSARSERVIVSEVDLRKFCTAMLVAYGVPRDDADLTVDVFVQSDLRGEESHGIRLLLQVLYRIKAGGDFPGDRSEIVSDRAATALIDAKRSLGQPVAVRAMQLAIDKARQFGIGMVGVRNANSYTSAKYYPLMAAAQGMIGITYTNSGVQLVTPHGGRKPLVGTNPLSIAAPALENSPFVLDMAISPAMEKIFQAYERDEKIPAGWAIDVDGYDTENPADVLASRSLLPWGGYKGFGLGLAHEILTCVLMGGQLFGGGATGFLPHDGPMNVSQTFQAISIEHFISLEQFKRQMDEALNAVHASGPRPGFDEVYYPGEKGFLEEQRRAREGIPVQQRVVSELNALAAEVQVGPLA
ncbi:Ldh family oxidoreductase [Aquamicrobium ahrensii]|uniref:LDH2 family malate/lactate/ureidoglycolate dehydrogenase n=1 Tax=Aquamicrobium ahrensii TaxID=469551 RepID=A0ABV2KJC2_9HYPH